MTQIKRLVLFKITPYRFFLLHTPPQPQFAPASKAFFFSYSPVPAWRPSFFIAFSGSFCIFPFDRGVPPTRLLLNLSPHFPVSFFARFSPISQVAPRRPPRPIRNRSAASPFFSSLCKPYDPVTSSAFSGLFSSFLQTNTVWSARASGYSCSSVSPCASFPFGITPAPQVDSRLCNPRFFRCSIFRRGWPLPPSTNLHWSSPLPFSISSPL